MEKIIDNFDREIVRWMKKYGINFLRYSLAIVFIWFGFLKVIGFSPATELVSHTVYWVDSGWFVPFLGWWEVIIGVCFLFKSFIRPGVFLMIVQMVGTFLPLILLPEVVFNGSIFYPTLEGQYIIKNLVLISAAIVVGSHVRDKK